MTAIFSPFSKRLDEFLLEIVNCFCILFDMEKIDKIQAAYISLS
jgi:hypothetical protein